MSILDMVGCGMPSFFQYLSDTKLIHSDHILFTKDGFYMIGKSISSILISKGIAWQAVHGDSHFDFCLK